MTIPSYEIVKRLYIWFVVAVAILPRQHVDRTHCSIGGSADLSIPFKRLLLGVSVINFIRFILKDSSIRKMLRPIADILGIIQQFGTLFLCFLTPYILQKWLSPYINIRRPGANLMTPLYICTILSIASVVLVRLSHPNWWALRKIGNALSSPPVLSTLTTFNQVTTRGGHHQGRGSILSQSLKIVEVWFCLTQILCAIGFAFGGGKGHGGALGNNNNNSYVVNEENQWDELLSAFREIAFVSEWTRILAHALFINQLEELYLSSPGATTSHTTTPDDNNTSSTSSPSASTSNGKVGENGIVVAITPLGAPSSFGGKNRNISIEEIDEEISSDGSLTPPQSPSSPSSEMVSLVKRQI